MDTSGSPGFGLMATLPSLRFNSPTIAFHEWWFLIGWGNEHPQAFISSSCLLSPVSSLQCLSSSRSCNTTYSHLLVPLLAAIFPRYSNCWSSVKEFLRALFSTNVCRTRPSAHGCSCCRDDQGHYRLVHPLLLLYFTQLRTAVVPLHRVNTRIVQDFIA